MTYCKYLTGLFLLIPGLVYAAENGQLQDFTSHWGGIICVIVFCFAYSLVIVEEVIHLRKSKPVMVAAGIIWIIVAFVYAQSGDTHTAGQAVRHNLLEFVELFLFLLVAMTYINIMEDRGIFDVLRSWLVSKGFSFRTIFCLTGVIAFVVSPIADNLTTALLMATIVMAVGKTNTDFVILACINVVVAANAGGAFSPFGDITTLMVWQKGGLVAFQQFFYLFVPSLVNWLVPAAIIFFFVPPGFPDAIDDHAEMKKGALIVIGLFLFTISLAVCLHTFLHLPPVIGMMTGLGLLNLYGYYLKMRSRKIIGPGVGALGIESLDNGNQQMDPEQQTTHFDVYRKLANIEWDTLMFFYGVMLCVGGLGILGYLELMSGFMYDDLGATTANILVGFLSAIIDNIPVMFAVLSMLPDMNLGQWLLVTLTAGVGGSLLSVGSAAGIAVMGQARGIYTFWAHLKWSWAILLGYAAAIWMHIFLNSHLFE
ncbi:MAG: sodium:proton antiporter NhaD [Gammaproteobacteria bacterium]|nr:sodium:proton antiporter NhaD [Gammaproteobacteria bacterium]